MLAACELALSSEPRCVDRLTHILTRLRQHASKDAGIPNSNPLRGHQLPVCGFETLVLLCNVVLRASAASEDFVTPYALLQLTGAYFQRRTRRPTTKTIVATEEKKRKGEEQEGEEQKLKEDKDERENEYLSARLCEHPVFADLRLWHDVLAAHLESVSSGPEVGKRVVVQQLTSLLYQMRAVTLDPALTFTLP